MTIFINPFTGTRKTFIISAVACLAVTALLGGLAAGRTVYAAGGDVEINETNFPDEVFRSYVKICDSNEDNKLSPDESKSKTEFLLINKEIKDLKGIEYFTALEYLSCHGNQLTSLDLSKNTALEELVCYRNQLTELNVSGCTKLKRLDCRYNQLKVLDVSRFEELESLSCEDNQLTISHREE